MDVIFEPVNSVVVGAWGLILGVISLLITIIGFAISIAQIRRTLNSADAAIKAVNGVQIRVSRYDAAIDLAQAKVSLQTARHFSALDAWPLFVANYEIAYEALGRVTLQATIVSEADRDKIKKARTRILKSCNSIEKFFEGAGPLPTKSDLNKDIRLVVSVVQEVEQANWKGVAL